MLECPRVLSLYSCFLSVLTSRMISSTLMILNSIFILMTPKFISLHGTSSLNFRPTYSNACLFPLLHLIGTSSLTCFFFSFFPYFLTVFSFQFFPSNSLKVTYSVSGFLVVTIAIAVFVSTLTVFLKNMKTLKHYNFLFFLDCYVINVILILSLTLEDLIIIYIFFCLFVFALFDFLFLMFSF